MIGKSVARKKSSKSLASSVRDLTKYVRDCGGEMATPGEKVLFSGSKNFVFEDDFALQVDEMVALAKAGCRGKNSDNPIKHYILSWPESEAPTQAQANEAVDMLLAELRLTQCQTQWAVHKDTDNVHVHVVVNRVDPDSEKIIKPGGGFEHESMQRAIAKIEHAQGWQPEKNARYTVGEDGQCVRVKTKKEASTEPSEAAKSMELRTGEKSQERIGIELAGPAIGSAKSWSEIHAALEKLGMRYERKDGGAVLWTGAEYVKASAVCKRQDSFAQLQKRLGPYQLQGEKIEYFTHEIADAGDAWHRPQDGLRKLSECHLATDRGPKSGPGLLSPDARPGRFQSEPVRRESPAAGGRGSVDAGGRNNGPVGRPGDASNAGSRASGGESGSHDAVARRPGGSGPAAGGRLGRREPLNKAFKNWPAYSAARTAHYASKNAEAAALRASHLAARKELQQLQKQQRTKFFSGSWKGRADALNALRSVVASDQLKTRLRLQDKIKAERLALQKRHRPWPDFETWTKIEDGDEAALAWRNRGQTATSGIFIKPVAKDIRDYLAEVSGRVVVYKDASGNVAFTDNGRLINVHSIDDPAAILAVLQLSLQKWGSVQVVGADEKFRTMCVEVAARNNIVLGNPDLAIRVQKLRDDAGKTGGSDMEVKERPAPMAPRVDAASMAKNAQDVAEKLRQMKHVEDVHGAKAAQEWRDSWLESIERVEPKKPSFSIEPYSYVAQKSMLGRVHHHYSDASGARAFTDTGRVIQVHSKSDEALLAAMKLGFEKCQKPVMVKSKDAEFIERCVKVAAANGMDLGNPELQEQVLAIRAEAIRQAAENKPKGDPLSMHDEQQHKAAVAGLKDRFMAGRPTDDDQVRERQR